MKGILGFVIYICQNALTSITIEEVISSSSHYFSSPWFIFSIRNELELSEDVRICRAGRLHV